MWTLNIGFSLCFISWAVQEFILKQIPNEALYDDFYMHYVQLFNYPRSAIVTAAYMAYIVIVVFIKSAFCVWFYTYSFMNLVIEWIEIHKWSIYLYRVRLFSKRQKCDSSTCLNTSEKPNFLEAFVYIILSIQFECRWSYTVHTCEERMRPSCSERLILQSHICKTKYSKI